MSTLIEEKFKEAMDKKQVDLNSFIWKGEKTLDSDGRYKQSEIKMRYSVYCWLVQNGETDIALKK